jgi:hypothetical protein
VAEYRIVRAITDPSKCRVEIRRWWFPFWMEADEYRMHKSVTDARVRAGELAKPPRVIEYLGRLK